MEGVFDRLAHFARREHALARRGEILGAGAGVQRILDRVIDFRRFLFHPAR